MKHPIINMALLVSIGSLTACGSVTPPNQSGTTTARNAAIGAAVGAGIGQLWGKDTESTLTGAAIGGLIGSQVRTPDGTGTYQQQPVYNNGGYNQPTYNNGGYNSGYNNGGYNNGGYYNGGYGR